MSKKMGAQLLWSIIYAILGGLVFILGLNLLRYIPRGFQDVYKVGLSVLLLVAYFVSQRYAPNQQPVILAFFLVSVGWLLDNYLTGEIKDLFSLDSRTMSGFAGIMVISTLLVSAPVLLGWLVSGRSLSAIYIRSDKSPWGIVVGLVGLLSFAGLGGLQALGQGLTMKVIGAALPMALVFSLANGFREELVYRAVFLKGFQANIGIAAAIVVTTLVFALAHIDAGYDTPSMIVFSIVLVMIGVVGSLIMIKTESLVGAILFHAGADMLLMMTMLSSRQLTLG
ncbi:MAG: CPBP family intramembrane metalloprotease [Anaerolineae bacterium]|nr:CPBP family intramembrane metalloprotease [Anaerolineae bacterium]